MALMYYAENLESLVPVYVEELPDGKLAYRAPVVMRRPKPLLPHAELLKKIASEDPPKKALLSFTPELCLIRGSRASAADKKGVAWSPVLERAPRGNDYVPLNAAHARTAISSGGAAARAGELKLVALVPFRLITKTMTRVAIQ